MIENTAEAPGSCKLVSEFQFIEASKERAESLAGYCCKDLELIRNEAYRFRPSWVKAKGQMNTRTRKEITAELAIRLSDEASGYLEKNEVLPSTDCLYEVANILSCIVCGDVFSWNKFDSGLIQNCATLDPMTGFTTRLVIPRRYGALIREAHYCFVFTVICCCLNERPRFVVGTYARAGIARFKRLAKVQRDSTFKEIAQQYFLLVRMSEAILREKLYRLSGVYWLDLMYTAPSS